MMYHITVMLRSVEDEVWKTFPIYGFQLMETFHPGNVCKFGNE